jgi:S-adenosylmethionine:tRNA ribosyltransferase-isomerase
MNSEQYSVKNIRIEEFDYPLPDEKIAKYPLEQRDKSKLLIYRNSSIIEDTFTNLPNILPTGAHLVFNNTRVIPARLHFRKTTGASIEIFCLEPAEPSDYQLALQSSRQCTWKCIVGNLKKWKDEALTKDIVIGNKTIQLTATKVEKGKNSQLIRFSWNDTSLIFSNIIEIAGDTPIPPYLCRESEPIDKERYQTVYSKVKGSVAAPTAGLHFTPDVMDRLTQKGISTSEVTLHVGAGTFKPVQSETIEGHDMHTEFFSITLDALKKMKANHGKLIATGTTTLRTLESIYWLGVKLKQTGLREQELPHLSQWDAYTLKTTMNYTEAIDVIIQEMEKQGRKEFWATTQIIIAPGYQIKSIEALITNFHQPKSTLLLLVSAITGKGWKNIYQYALEHNFRFLSYGDSSLLYLK